MNHLRPGKLAWLLPALAWTTLALAEDREARPPAPAERRASVSLKIPRSASIGDHIQGEFISKNAGARPLQIRSCGDFGMGPNPWLRVAVKDAKGNLLPNLAPDEGGLLTPEKLSIVTLAPGESASVRWPLEAYAGMLGPGNYTVSISGRFGWPGGPDLPPLAAAAKFVIEEASAREIAACMHRLCAQRATANIWDLQHVTSPLFLPALMTEARAGHAEACLGVGSILTEEANQALLDLTRSSDPPVARGAALALRLRLPFRANEWDSARVSGCFIYPRDLVLGLWRAKFDAPLLAVAVRLLDHSQPIANISNPAAEVDAVLFDDFYLGVPDSVSLGAQMIRARGGPDQAAALLQATQWALDRDRKPRKGESVKEAPAPLYSLLQTMDALRTQGWRTDESDASAMELAYLRALADPKITRPANNAWQEVVRSALKSNSAVLRENAVRMIPLPLTEKWEPLLRTALEDEDDGVVCGACKVAGQSGRQELIRPLTQVLEGVHQREAQSDAAEAALRLGGGMELWDALCEVIPDRAMYGDALLHLLRGTIDFPPLRGYGYHGDDGLTREQRFLVREAWRTFLAHHHELLASDKRVPPDDPSITSRLTGAEFTRTSFITIQLPDGAAWVPAGK